MMRRLPGYRNPKNFIVVSDPYPTVTAQAADLVLPTAMWIEKEGAYGNAERRTQFWRQQVECAGPEARSDLWQLMEFSKRFKVEEVWPAELIAAKPEYKGKTLVSRSCLTMAKPTSSKSRLSRIVVATNMPIDEMGFFSFLCAKRPVRGISSLPERGQEEGP